MKIEYKPIGIIHTPFQHPKGMPIQPAGAEGIRGTVEVFDEYVEGLNDVDGFSRIVLLYHFHQAKPAAMRVIPFMDTQLRGLFATRAPARPNPIGLSIVRLIGIEGNILTIENVDMLDGTPLLDIKPHVSEFASPASDRIGWLEQARGRAKKKKSDDRFA